MAALPPATLHLCLDADLSPTLAAALGAVGAGSDVGNSSSSSTAPPLSSSPPFASRVPSTYYGRNVSVAVHANCTTPAAQSILVFSQFHNDAEWYRIGTQQRGGVAAVMVVAPPLASVVAERLVAAWSETVDLFVCIDYAQVAVFFSKAATTAAAADSATSSGGGGGGALGAYLRAVCDATIASHLSLMLPTSTSSSAAAGTRERLSEGPSDAARHRHLRVHVIAAPGLVNPSGGVARPSLSANQAAALLAGAFAASLAWTDYGSSSSYGGGGGAPPTATSPPADPSSCSSFSQLVRVSLGSCAILTSVTHAAATVAAVANKRLQSMVEDVKEAQRALKGKQTPTTPTRLLGGGGEEGGNSNINSSIAFPVRPLASSHYGNGNEEGVEEGDAGDDFDLDCFGLEATTSTSAGNTHANVVHNSVSSRHNTRHPAAAAAAAAAADIDESESESESVDPLAWLTAVRPDTNRKCEPHDFQRLYATMLSEIGSFSERKALAAVAAFPTLHHLLSYLDAHANSTDTNFSNANVIGAAAARRQGSPVPSVYSSNFGESRAWNVLNEAVVDALMNDYRQHRGGQPK